MSNLQLGLRFRIERGLRLVMGAQVKPLPEGWHEFVKHEKVWQWRCPWGELCGKHNQLLYENENKETVLDSAAMHLCNAVEHEEFENFNIARDCAKDDGLNEITVKTTVYYDEDGVEHKDVPHATAKKMPQPPVKGPTQEIIRTVRNTRIIIATGTIIKTVRMTRSGITTKKTIIKTMRMTRSAITTKKIPKSLVPATRKAEKQAVRAINMMQKATVSRARVCARQAANIDVLVLAVAGHRIVTTSYRIRQAAQAERSLSILNGRGLQFQWLQAGFKLGQDPKTMRL